MLWWPWIAGGLADAFFGLDWEGGGDSASQGGAVSVAGAGRGVVGGDWGRESDCAGGQSSRVEGAAAEVRGAGEVHLYRSALQYRERGLGVQRQHQRPGNPQVAGGNRRQGGRGSVPSRQVALHDVSPPGAAEK